MSEKETHQSCGRALLEHAVFERTLTRQQARAVTDPALGATPRPPKGGTENIPEI